MSTTSRLAPLLLSLLVLANGCATPPTGGIVHQPARMGELAPLPAVALPPSVRQDANPGGGYLIGPEDVLQIKVYDNEKMDATMRVAREGTIRFAPLGEIPVQGLSEREVETELENRLRGTYLKEPHVTVLVSEQHAHYADIVGEVRNPGRYAIRGGDRLSDLISKAGGLTEHCGATATIMEQDTASTASLQLRAADGESTAACQRVDLVALFIDGRQEGNLPIHRGDLIHIPSAGSVHVTGPGVAEPGSYPLRFQPTTIREIIDQAGGLRFAARDRLVVYRTDARGGEQQLTCSYRSLESDGAEHLVLQPGDLVLARQSMLKTPLAWIAQGVAKVFRANVYLSRPL